MFLCMSVVEYFIKMRGNEYFKQLINAGKFIAHQEL